jgi:hypothetical protein
VASATRALNAARVDVPEPSPLFWEHFSSRVHDAIAQEPEPRLSWFRPAAAVLAAFAVVVVVVALAQMDRTSSSPAAAPGTPTATTAPVDTVAVNSPDVAAAPDNDAPLDFVADLAADVDWDAAAEAGLTATRGTADRVLFDLSSEESVELERLLKEAIAQGPSRAANGV